MDKHSARRCSQIEFDNSLALPVSADSRPLRLAVPDRITKASNGTRKGALGSALTRRLRSQVIKMPLTCKRDGAGPRPNGQFVSPGDMKTTTPTTIADTYFSAPSQPPRERLPRFARLICVAVVSAQSNPLELSRQIEISSLATMQTRTVIFSELINVFGRWRAR